MNRFHSSTDNTYSFLSLPAGHEVIIYGRCRLPPRTVENLAAMFVLHVAQITRYKHRVGLIIQTQGGTDNTNTGWD